METHLDNLSRIKAAWAMGWSATLELTQSLGIVHNRCIVQVLIPDPDLIVTIGELSSLETWKINHKNFNKPEVKILGFKYGAELCGNGVIPEGQRFRVKATGNTFPLFKEEKNDICLAKGYGSIVKRYHKSEITPVFT